MIGLMVEGKSETRIEWLIERLNEGMMERRVESLDDFKL
jgi:hypothetical protein